MTAAATTSDHAHGAMQQPSKWLPLAVASVAATLVAAFGYYGLQYFRSSTFNDERAFRVLAEMIGQFGNFQKAITGLFPLVPFKAGSDAETRDTFLAGLSLPRLSLTTNCTATQAKTRLDAHKDPASQFVIDTSTANRDFHACGLLGVDHSDQPQRHTVELSGSLKEHLPTFMGQEFFDLVVITLADGTAVADLPARRHRESRIPLHEANAHGLVVGNASALLQHAAEQEAGEKPAASKGDKPSGSAKAPSHPVVFTDTIAGETYRVFVQPFEPDYAVQLGRTSDAKDSDAPAAQNSLYLVGLKRQDLLGSMNDSLGSAGMLTITLLALLAVLAWPLLSLRFSTPREAISPTQVFAIVIALLLIPSLLTVVGFSFWSNYRLAVWSDQSAERYGAAVEQALLEEVSDDTRVLDKMAQAFASRTQWADDDFTATSRWPTCFRNGKCDHPLAPMVAAEEPFAGWSRLHIVAPLNSSGRSSGVSLDAFNARASLEPLDLSDRGYFKAIVAGEQWRPGKLWCDEANSCCPLKSPANGFVAQRLFNRSDADRALQIAVPMMYTAKARGKPASDRTGIITGDSRAYALTKSIRPPLLRFAILDSNNGAVLFHSDDRRSLAENFLVETENNGALQRLMRKRASSYMRGAVTLEDHFHGRYLGESHRFYYRAVKGMPWGVIVYYPVDDLSEIVLQTAVATLATSFSFMMLIILLLGALVVVLPGRADRWLLALIWPRWERHELYVAFARLGSVVLLAIAFFVLAKLHASSAASMTAVAAAGVSAIAVRRLRTTAVIRRPVALESYQSHYVACMAIVMFACCALPTAWLAVDYHDTSVKAFIRDELQQSAADVERRHDDMARDVQRFRGKANASGNPIGARTLSESLAVPGYTVRTGKVAADKESSTWILADAVPGLWLTRCGPPILDTVRSAIWAMSTSRHAQRPLVLSAEGNDAPTPGRRATEASSDTCKDKSQVVAYWQRSEDGHRVKMAMPLRSASPAGEIRVDAELRKHYERDAPLRLAFVLAASLVLTLLMCWHTARRLFGIRIPFAGRFSGNEGNRVDLGGLVDAELKLIALRKQHGADFTRKDEKDWRTVHCEALYASMWNKLGPGERLLMHQIARGGFANPENQAVLERLLRWGYLKQWPWPRIMEDGFASYICNMQTREQFAELQRESAHGVWSRIRTPLLMVVVLAAGLLMWFAGSSMQILSAALAGTAALFSSISQVTGFIRKDSKTSGS